MTADKLCCRVNNDISTVFDRSDKIRSTEGVVNNNRYTVLVCDLRNCINIRNITVGVAECFKVNCLCVVFDGSLEFLKVMSINKCCINAELGKCVGK